VHREEGQVRTRAYLDRDYLHTYMIRTRDLFANMPGGGIAGAAALTAPISACAALTAPISACPIAACSPQVIDAGLAFKAHLCNSNRQQLVM
jgi:hypothetical protein